MWIKLRIKYVDEFKKNYLLNHWDGGSNCHHCNSTGRRLSNFIARRGIRWLYSKASNEDFVFLTSCGLCTQHLFLLSYIIKLYNVNFVNFY